MANVLAVVGSPISRTRRMHVHLGDRRALTLPSPPEPEPEPQPLPAPQPV